MPVPFIRSEKKAINRSLLVIEKMQLWGGKFIVSRGRCIFKIRWNSLRKGRGEIFSISFFSFFLSSLFPTISERESLTFRASANYFDFDVSLTALCPIEKFLSIRRKLFPQFPASCRGLQCITFFFSFVLLRSRPFCLSHHLDSCSF